MLVATLLALGSAVIHAGWNMTIKQGGEDRWLLLWGQFFLAACLTLPLLIALGGIPLRSWWWVALSGGVHLPYTVLLAKAYDHGDFSLVYPIARGGGALLAALGGVLFASDSISAISALGITVTGLGLFLLANRLTLASIRPALLVAMTIGLYTVIDAKGIRVSGTKVYAVATTVGTAMSTTAFGLATHRASEMRRVLMTKWKRLAIVGFASTVTYAMVQIAMLRAPVGYVSALRESSVLIAAFVGWRKFGEPAGTRRLFAAATIVSGLLLLVLGRG